MERSGIGNQNNCAPPYLTLQRFLDAQETAYPRALAEIQNGRKESHWMWYVFPQLRGLGRSNTAWYYGIENLAEAKDYLSHPTLGFRLREISGLLLKCPETDPKVILGWTDAAKLRSCMTLFSIAAEEDSVFRQVLDRFWPGDPDPLTVSRLKDMPKGGHT